MPELTEGVDVKDCPFCGGNAILYPRNNPDGVYAGEMWWFFMCRICGAQSKPYESKAAAIAAWNARAEDAAIATLRARVAELEAAQRWIPVTERLPEDDTVILGLFMEYSRPQICAFRRYGKGWIEENDGDTYHSGITHWMPLPQPPKEVE